MDDVPSGICFADSNKNNNDNKNINKDNDNKTCKNCSIFKTIKSTHIKCLSRKKNNHNFREVILQHMLKRYIVIIGNNVKKFFKINGK